MNNPCITFNILERHGKFPVGYMNINGHLVFDLKLDMTRKAWYVAGGHLTDLPTHMNYSSIMYCDTLHIGFLMDTLNGLYILAGDIKNTFLEEPTEEKILFYAGNEWKYDNNGVVVVICALYGLKSITLKFRNHLAQTLGNKIGFRYYLADPDLWYKYSTSPYWLRQMELFSTRSNPTWNIIQSRHF